MGFGAILSGIGVGASAIGSVASSALGFVGSIASTAVNAIGHVAQVGLGVLKVAGGVLAGAVGAFVGAVGLASKATLDFSNNILSIKASTGMGFGAASKTAMNFGAFGVSSGELSGLLDSVNMIPQFFKARAGAFNLPGYDSKNFIPDLAREFQKLGPIVGRGMLETLGMDTPSIRRLAAMSPEKLQAQQQYSTRIQTSLGVKPGDVQNWAEDFSLLMDRVGQFTDLVKYRFASEMLPFLSSALERVTDYLGRNSGKISALIKQGVSWLFEDLPGLINTAVHTAANWGHGLVAAFGAVSSTVSNFLRTLADTSSAFWTFAGSLARIADLVIALVPRSGDLSNGAVAPGGTVNNTTNTNNATNNTAATTLQRVISNSQNNNSNVSYTGGLGMLPGNNTTNTNTYNRGGIVGMLPGENLLSGKTFNYASNALGRVTEKGPVSTAFDRMKAAAPDTLNNLADSIDKRTKAASDAINGAIDKGVSFWDNNVSSLINETNKKMDAQGKDLKGIRQATEKMANGGNGSPMSATIERFEGYIAEDAWALANR